MRKYRYFKDVRNNASFTDIPCDFCEANEDCLDGVYFEDGKLDSICLECFQKGKAKVVIPSYISSHINEDALKKTKELSETPPVPWIQYNEWPICGDDYMTYIGEWGQAQFNEFSPDGNGYSLFGMILNDEVSEERKQYLWNNLGRFAAAFVFVCSKCGKQTAVVQEY